MEYNFDSKHSDMTVAAENDASKPLEDGQSVFLTPAEQNGHGT